MTVKRLVYGGIAALALSLIAGSVAALTLGRQAEAGGLSPPAVGNLPALPNIAALTKDAAPKAKSGQVAIGGLAQPVNGEVRFLLTDAGATGFTVAAWPAGAERVCFRSSGGGGGCFEKFLEPFNWVISDPDRLGSGEPLYVWGLVPDSVASVTATVSGRELPAVVRNNAAFVRLTDPAALPDAVQGFNVTFRDGSAQFVPHAVVLPAELRSSEP